ncbi:hypothetical protein N7414_06725 [Pseudomonas sp. GD04087]|uniref:hypothetical protein n=1 Tax=Pseudomonas TaxID=286 RepID=UPI001F395C14|nr:MULTISPECIES: hypothetical protein [Pseudomonas]MDH0288801.1 hypothetical protein [Pseudomonas sp. GD04087]MDH1052718.1 hypothetical protein [Pseudomonas sp. GD03903]MDH2001837.1 hypothetical protein [Pseudomonas sp. GD03691]
MPALRALPALFLAALCGPAFADDTPTPIEDCLDLASRTFAADSTMQERWQQSWLDHDSLREEAYDGEVEGQHASKALKAQMREGERVAGQFTCLLTGSGKPLSVQYQVQPSEAGDATEQPQAEPAVPST